LFTNFPYLINAQEKIDSVTVLSEVFTIAEEMPKFTPGKQRNIPVNVNYVIPFYFRKN